MKGGGGEKVLGRFGGGGGRERIDELGDLGLVRIANDPGHAGECGQFFGRALRITTSDDNAGCGVGGVKLSNGVASLGVGRGRDGAGVDDDDVGGGWRGDRRTTTVEQLTLDGSAIGLRGAATELFDEEARHLIPCVESKTLCTEFAEYRDRREEKIPFSTWRERVQGGDPPRRGPMQG
jgi:hypothetical protein